MEMFSDLRQFDQAKQWAEQYAAQRGDTSTVVDLMSRQAEWSEQSSDYEAAAEMFVKAKKWVARCFLSLALAGLRFGCCWMSLHS
jgi:intraflagellar transport protein 122